MQMHQLIGQTFGRLHVIGHAGVDKNHHSLWKCRCACGNEVIKRGLHLKGGQTYCCYSCPLIPHPIKHGRSKTSEYASWHMMKRRCYDKNFHAYPAYGGKGIIIHKRWRKSFKNFLADMGPKPTPKHTIDRWPNQKGNYEPGNCRWATPFEQTHNRKPVTEWKPDRKENISKASKNSWKKRKEQRTSAPSKSLS